MMNLFKHVCSFLLSGS